MSEVLVPIVPPSLLVQLVVQRLAILLRPICRPRAPELGVVWIGGPQLHRRLRLVEFAKETELLFNSPEPGFKLVGVRTKFLDERVVRARLQLATDPLQIGGKKQRAANASKDDHDEDDL